MPDAAVDRTTRALIDKYGDLGRQSAERLQEWLSGTLPYTHPEVLEAHCQKGQIDLLFDAFWQLLPFGTGGRRGRVGYGSNRVNHTTVAMTVQGHCEYLRKAFPDRKDLSVVVANDVRVFYDIGQAYEFLGNDHPLYGASSRSFAKLACEIYVANGIDAYLNEPTNESAVLSTPQLSFLIVQLGAVGGVNFSASHNPPDDNGLKIYDPFGSQPVAPDDQNLLDVMKNASKIGRVPFEKALAEGRVKDVPAALHKEYFDMYVRLFDGLHKPSPQYPVVYTPLCGCGLLSAGALLQRVGFPMLTPADEAPDGRFACIPFRAPNPEVPQSTEPARAFADKNGSKIVLSSDPDVDRIGVEVKVGEHWVHLDGNQIAAVLAYYLMLDPKGPKRKGLVVETLVTSKLVRAIAEKAGNPVVDDLLVGFKYVADLLKQLKATGRYGSIQGKPEDLILAVEESHGLMMLPVPAEKDSAPGCLYIAALYQRLCDENRTILDYYYSILEELGAYDVMNRSLMMVGAEGMLRIERIMKSLRDAPPKTLGGQTVREIVDHWDAPRFGPFKSESDKLPRNVLEIVTDRVTFAVRPSGTEPKLKFYCQLKSDGPPKQKTNGAELQKQARAEAERISLVTYNDLLGRIDLKLSDAALLLPDIIDFNRKQDFDARVVPELRRALAEDRFAQRGPLLDWLRAELKGMLPGDPLPATKAAVAYLCRAWTAELRGKPVVAELEAWATS
jgi:phosphoglucomutase/phosphomannomutase